MTGLAAAALLLSTTAGAQTCSTSCSTTSGVTTCTSTDVIQTVNTSGSPTDPPQGSPLEPSVYPSCITVSGVSGTVATVQVQLGVSTVGSSPHGMVSNGSGNYLSLQGTEILLVSPTGDQLELLGNPGDGSDGLSGAILLIGDSNATNTNCPDGFSPMPNGSPAGFPSGGTQCYEPSSYDSASYGGTFPSPGPGAVTNYPQTSGDHTLDNGSHAVFTGATAAGDWDLYMVDDFGDPVTINGWELILTVNETEIGTTTVVNSSQQPAYLTSPNNTVTYTATVTASGSPVTAGGTVAFYANGTQISCSGGNQALNSSGQATCETSASDAGAPSCSASTPPGLGCQGITTITATYSGSGSYQGGTSSALDQLVEAHSTQNGTTWCNTAPAPIQGVGDPAMYPSVIQVSGVSNSVANLTVELEGVTGAVGIGDEYLLVAPDGTHNLDFFDNGFSANAANGVNLTFSDTAGGFVPDSPPVSGTYVASDNFTVNGETNEFSAFESSTAPTFDSTIPQVPSSGNIHFALPYGGTNGTTAYNFEQAFGSAAANGTWALYVNGYIGNEVILNSGWCLDFTLNSGAATTTALASSQQKANTGQAVTFTATVSSGGNPVTSGTVTFEDSGATPAGTVSGNNVVTPNGSGQATFTTSSLTEGDHNIQAFYSGVANTYDASNTSMYQREDKATTVSNASNNTATYCNTAGVTDPGYVESEEIIGDFTPNPSNIFVTNLPGTVSSVTVTLDSLDIPTQDNELFGLESLLVGPSANLDFFSLSGGTASPSTGNYIFSDSSGSTLNTSSIAPGTYKPISDDSTADTFTQDPGHFYTLPTSFNYASFHGSSTLASVFGSSNGNGTWSLYFNETASSTYGATGGWCLNFTETAPSVSVSTSHNGDFTQGEQNAQFTVSIDNNGTTGATGDPTGGSNPLNVTDTLNSDFTFASGSGMGWSCSGSGQTFSCTNDSAVAQGSSYPPLTVDVNVGTTSGSIGNAVSASGAGVSSTSSSSDSINVDPVPVTIAEAWGGMSVEVGLSTSLTFTLANPATFTQTSINFSDTLPSGLVVAIPSVESTNCSGGIVTATAGSNSVTFSGGSLTAGASCTVTVQVTGVTPGSQTNTTSTVSSTPGGTGLSVSATIDVMAGTTTSATVVDAATNGVWTNTEVAGASAYATASVTPSVSGPTPTGSVTYTFYSGSTCTSTSVGASTETLSSGIVPKSGTVGPLGAGTYSLSASYSGDSYHAGSSNTCTSFTVNKAQPTTSVGSAPNSSTPGQSVTLTATVSGGYSPAGTVGFTSNSVSIAGCTGVTLSSGQAQCMTSSLATGNDVIVATYSGDVNNLSSEGTLSGGQNVQASTYPLTVAAGTGGTIAANTAPNGSYNVGTVQTIAATPDAGYHFVNWTGANSPSDIASATSATTTVTMNGPENLTANFAALPLLVVNTNGDTTSGVSTDCTPQTSATSNTTDTACSLRDALAWAAASTAPSIQIGFDSKVFSASNSATQNTITLSNGTLTIPANTTIAGATTGSGASLTNLVTIAGSGPSSICYVGCPVLTVNSGVTAVEVDHLIVTNGGSDLPNLNIAGGGLQNAGTVVLNGDSFVANFAQKGGGIYSTGTLSMWNSTVSGNQATGAIDLDYGGGIFAAGTMLIVNSTISGNGANPTDEQTAGGGGIYNEGALTMVGVTFTGNFTSGINPGAGLWVTGGSVTILDSVFSGNLLYGSYPDTLEGGSVAAAEQDCLDDGFGSCP